MGLSETKPRWMGVRNVVRAPQGARGAVDLLPTALHVNE